MGNIGAAAKNHRNISAFFKIIHSNSSQGLFGSSRDALTLGGENCIPALVFEWEKCQTGLGELEAEPFLRLDTMLLARLKFIHYWNSVTRFPSFKHKCRWKLNSKFQRKYLVCAHKETKRKQRMNAP